MNMKRVVLTGGSGFVGRSVANRLAEAGISVLVPTRRRSRAGHLILLPTVEVEEADIHDPAALERLFAGADGVVNLVGILHSRPGTPFGPDFARAHVELPAKIVEACRKVGVPRLVHVSALGAAPDGPSEYQRSKAAGEAAVRGGGDMPTWSILRPSVIFGRDDSFLNLFAGLVRLFPVLPLAGAQARFQPVYVEDVAEVVWHCLADAAAAGSTFDVAGPSVYTLRQLVEYVCELIGKRRLIIPLPEKLAMAQAALMELLPSPLMSRDNVRSMRIDNVAGGSPFPFGLTPTSLEAVAPSWIGSATPGAGFHASRTRARRGPD